MSKKEKKESIIIALGGSLIVPDEINVSFLKEMKVLLRELSSQYQIALVVGGGKTARKYQAAAKHFPHLSNNDLDWIGIKSICLNAELLYRIFSDLNLYKEIIWRWEDARGIQEDIIIAGAWEPGYSSDTDAVELARVLSSKQVINFSNINYVYREDPRKNPNAERYERLSWKEYQALIPDTWVPGLSAPFDPVASRLAEEYGLRVVVLGASLENLKKYLEARDFEGTIIE